LRAAMDGLLAGRGIRLNVEIEINDNETMRLMVQQGVAASILPYSSVARECARGLLAAYRITTDGVFRTLAVGVRASRSASLAREAVIRTLSEVVAEMAQDGRLALGPRSRSMPRRGRPEPVMPRRDDSDTQPVF
ncbi:MAG TPA: LysR substrate-binding domain-containing protein, partial [Stellaceae bacterium]|nr:LysR substrate-binding domain-containing protein [Stellaceae bacterium]